MFGFKTAGSIGSMVVVQETDKNETTIIKNTAANFITFILTIFKFFQIYKFFG
jgi:hypothetical protein